MAGRKPLPTHLKIVKGTARSHRLNPSEPAPAASAPQAPGHLDERAKEKFDRLAKMLAAHGIMTVLDTAALARYCIIWCRWIDAEQEVKTRGPVVKPQGGNVIQNPFLAIANRCLSQMAQIESEFGMTPSSRSRIRAESVSKTVDPFESFLNGRGA
jgi:P27 family predicted phage terminase small subunit